MSNGRPLRSRVGIRPKPIPACRSCGPATFAQRSTDRGFGVKEQPRLLVCRTEVFHARRLTHEGAVRPDQKKGRKLALFLLREAPRSAAVGVGFLVFWVGFQRF